MRFKPVDPADLPDSTPITPAAPGCIAKIVVDKREMRCAVSKEIDQMRVDLKDHRLFSLPYGQFPDAKTSAGIDLEFRTLSVADYVLSDRVGAERKTTDDFLKTLLERRELFSQLMDLKMAYRRPLLIVEGEGGQNALFTSRMIDLQLSGRYLRPSPLASISQSFILTTAPKLPGSFARSLLGSRHMKGGRYLCMGSAVI